MNKSTLKTNWGKYADTDKMVDDIMNLLTTYRHRNSERGVCVMLDEYFRNKKPLIELLAKSPNYVGNMRVVMTKEFERDTDSNEVFRFCEYFAANVGAKDAIMKTVDADGKTMTDYMSTGVRSFDVSRMKDEALVQSLSAFTTNISKFRDDGFTEESSKQYRSFGEYMNKFKRITATSISDDNVTNFRRINEELKLAKGMKTSRAFNRVCDYYKISQLPQYNKLFAEYSDMVSGLVRNLDFVISVNPYDYLTMSFGKSWASCHTIDKTNQRNMPNSYSGMYCGGTLSYMLDGTSIITYVVDRGADVQTAGKIYRNMFHFSTSNSTLIQSRVYPQGNDGATDLYKKFRGFVQDELATLIGLESNMWKVKKGSDECRTYTTSEGAHYRDYTNFLDCNVSFPSERSDQAGVVSIGHRGICPLCGDTHQREAYLCCCC